MMRSQSPKKGKAKQKEIKKSGSIIDFFKKQHVKAQQQRQSELNWLESCTQASAVKSSEHGKGNRLNLLKEDTPSTSAYFKGESTPKKNEAPKSKLANLKRRDKSKLYLKRKSSMEISDDEECESMGGNEFQTTSTPDEESAEVNYSRKRTKTDLDLKGEIRTQKGTSSGNSNEVQVLNCDVLKVPPRKPKAREISKDLGNIKSTNDASAGEDNLPNAECSTSSTTSKILRQQSRESLVLEQESNLPNSQNSQSDTISESQNDELEEYRVPYYLENFLFILNAVINDEFYAYLFHKEDRAVISSFQNLSDSAQKLYVRLFGRIYRWLRKSKIVYPKIAEDLTDTLHKLCDSNLVMSEAEMDNLEEVLKSLPAPDIKTVAKSLRLNQGLVREEAIEAILKHTNQSNIGNFFSVGKNKGGTSKTGNSGLKKSVLQRSKKLLGSCYKLRRQPRIVFMRILMLFSLHNTKLEDSDRDTGQRQIFQMLMSNIGRVKYPEYDIFRTTKIFKNRESLVRFNAALQIETDIHEALERKDFDEALKIYTSAIETARTFHNNDAIQAYDKSLSPFLRCYTAGAVYIRILSYGVELLQFTKKYQQAVEQLQDLIAQDVYHLDYRGRWCERLALNLDFHLKQPGKALDIIKSALDDENIRKGHRYALFQRAQKICSAQSNKLKMRWQEFEADLMNCVQQAPEVFIQARKQEVPGGYPMFISEDSFTADNQNVTFMKCVEDVALSHYEKEGFTEGLHAEGGTLSFFFGLLLWDIIFMNNIPDAFYNLYQTHPLDYYSEHFYATRKDQIEVRLNEIRNASQEELEESLRKSWEEHQETFCIGVNWECYKDINHACGLLKCIGGQHLAAIFERFANDMRFTRSGLPDLTVWNPDTEKYKLVEVKGPGDRLSTKQILWLDYFLAIGVDAEVCYVKAIGAKKLLQRKS